MNRESMTILMLYNMMLRAAWRARQQDRNMDGQAFWQPIKKILSKSSWSAQWKPINQAYVCDVFDLDRRATDENKELVHFQFQTVNIPSKEEPSLRKIIQIALNVGQYIGTTGKHLRYESLDYFVHKRFADTRLVDTGLSCENVNELVKLLL